MREIKFRGLDSEIGVWRYGNLSMLKFANGGPFPAIDFYNDEGNYCKYWINPETVGQYAGLKDKNGKEIFEGDIVRTIDYDHDDESAICVIKYEGLSFFISDSKDGYVWEPDTELEIIGNVHENPELLKSQESAQVNL